MTFEFDEDTRVVAAEGGATAIVTDRWHTPAERPNGGYLLGICVQALALAAPKAEPLVVSALFLKAAKPGPATLRTELIRSGRRIAFAETRLAQDGAEVVRATAAFADPGEGRVLTLAGAPELPPPEACRDRFDGRPPGFSIGERVEYRLPPDAPEGKPYSEFWMRFRDGRPADMRSLPLFVDAALPVVAALGASSMTIELTVHVRAPPTTPWLACRVSTRFVSGGYHEEDFEIWDATGILLAQSRQLALFVEPDQRQ